MQPGTTVCFMRLANGMLPPRIICRCSEWANSLFMFKNHAVSVCIAIAIHIDPICIFNNILRQDARHMCAAYPTSSSEPTSWR